MLTEEYLNSVPDSVVDIWGELEEWLIKDICSRIMSAELYNYNAIPGAARWRINLLREAGMHYSEMIEVISKITKKSEAEVRKLFEESGLLSLDGEADMFKRQGIEPLDLIHTEVLRNILQETYNRANGEIRNFTRTTADASQKLLIDTLDKVYFDVTTGSRSYTEAIKDAIETVGKEAGKVYYNTGHKDTIETAIRRSVLTGINQGAGKLSVANAQALGAEYVVVSAHIGARVSEDPIANHSGWQGKIYKIEGSDKYPNLLDSTGFPLNPLGLCGYNCRHTIHAYFPGEPNPFEDVVKDKEASDRLYELSQKQRAMERNIRSTKKKLLAYESAMENCKDDKTKFELSLEYDKCAAKLKKQNKAYNDFCKENEKYGIKSERERLRTLNWKRENSDKTRSGASRYESVKQEGVPAILKKNKGNTIERSAYIDNMLNEYSTIPSKWSGKTILDYNACKNGKYAGKKAWSCDIITYNGASNQTLIHEHLHARSISYHTPRVYRAHQKIEEGTVELYSIEICKLNGLKYGNAYKSYVKHLRSINKNLGLYKDDFTFANTLFHIDVLDRWQWLSDKVERAIDFNKIDGRKAKYLRSLVDKLRGGVDE